MCPVGQLGRELWQAPSIENINRILRETLHCMAVCGSESRTRSRIYIPVHAVSGRTMPRYAAHGDLVVQPRRTKKIGPRRYRVFGPAYRTVCLVGGANKSEM